MVLEDILPVNFVENKPVFMLLLSIVITTVSVFAAHFIFPEYAGIVTPLLITVAMSPLIYKIFTIEEEIERKEAEHKVNLDFMGRHGETMLLFGLFFFGSFISFFILAIIMPGSFTSSIFAPQIDAIESISSISGLAVGSGPLTLIMVNNLKVMFFSFLLSFLMGAGAIYILSWNASILAIYLASFINRGLMSEFFTRSLGVIPHAPVEVIAYFLAGMAGGILSAGLLREHINSKEFMLIFKDSLKLLVLSVLAILIGAFLEVFL